MACQVTQHLLDLTEHLRAVFAQSEFAATRRNKLGHMLDQRPFREPGRESGRQLDLSDERSDRPILEDQPHWRMWLQARPSD